MGQFGGLHITSKDPLKSRYLQLEAITYQM